jgi:hypothetical protein
MATVFRTFLSLSALLLLGCAGGGGSVNVPPESISYGREKRGQTSF